MTTTRRNQIASSSRSPTTTPDLTHLRVGRSGPVAALQYVYSSAKPIAISGKNPPVNTPAGVATSSSMNR